MITKLRPILLPLALAMAGYFLPAPAALAAEKVSVAPAWKLQNLEGKTVQLSDFKGKVVVLNFWATWCPPCRAEIPDLVALQKRYAARGLVVVGISLDEGGPAKVASFVKKMGINYQVVMGNQEIAQAYDGIEVVPTTFIIDRKGNVASALQGATNVEGFEAQIKPVLEEK
ncbi:MAG: TlpA disulfide reductase family protein [Chthoniobacterales bacterium]